MTGKWLRRIVLWLDRNYRRLLVVGLFANAAAYLMLTFYYAFCLETMETVAREEVRKWLATHDITVVVQQPRTIEVSEDVLIMMLAMLLFLVFMLVVTRD